MVKAAKGGQIKVGKVMREFKAGKLHSGKKGPVVKSRKTSNSNCSFRSREVEEKIMAKQGLWANINRRKKIRYFKI
jgi:hypothetical protein